MKLVAFDASDQLIAELREGLIDSIVVQNPFRMGYESTRAIGLKLSGVMTFFFNVYYFQYHFTKLAEMRQNRALRPMGT